MGGQHILRGHYLTPERRRAQANLGLRPIRADQSIAEDRLWLQRMRKLAGTDEKGPKTSPEKDSLFNDEDDAWVQHMRALAGDAPQDEKEKEKSHEQLDADLIHDFIHHQGDFAL